MKTNLEKWNHYKTLIDHRASEYMDTISAVIPKNFYMINVFQNKVYECEVLKRIYSIQGLWYNGKKPTKKDIIKIAEIYEQKIDFTPDKAFFEYKYHWGDGGTARTAIKINTLLSSNGAWLNKEDAEMALIIERKLYEENKAFDEQHKKDPSYDYPSNGYKFLGWLNSGITDKEAYQKCFDLKHRRIGVSHNRRGSENTISCPICKIYYKYDCSD